jgi:hypothetical protein
MLTEDQAVERLEILATRDGKRYEMSAFQELKNFLEENRKYFIFEPDGSMWGFSLNIYRHPPFPGTDPIKITRVSGNALPEEMRIEEKIAPGRRLDDGMRELSPFSHTEENEKFLRDHGMELPHDLGHYEY